MIAPPSSVGSSRKVLFASVLRWLRNVVFVSPLENARATGKRPYGVQTRPQPEDAFAAGALRFRERHPGSSECKTATGHVAHKIRVVAGAQGRRVQWCWAIWDGPE